MKEIEGLSHVFIDRFKYLPISEQVCGAFDFFPVFEEVIENMAHKAQLHFLPQYLSTEGPF